MRTGLADASESKTLIDHVVDQAIIGIALAGPDGCIVHANPAFGSMLGCTPNDCAGCPVVDLIAPDMREEARQLLCALQEGEAKPASGEWLCAHRDGATFWANISFSTVRAGPVRLIVQLEDIDQRKRTEAALARNETRMNYALESAGQGVWDYDFNTREMFYSQMWRSLRGFGPDEEIDGAQDVWLARVHPEDRERIREIIKKQDSGEIERNAFEYRERHRDGHWIWILSRGKVIDWNPDGSPARIIGTDTDITRLKEEEARRAAEAEATFHENLAKLQEAHQAAEAAQQLALSLSRHDALTGLPNRRVFAEVLDKAVAKAKRGASTHAVLIIDLDQFKPVNDLYGHAAGDTVLCKVANRLKDLLRSEDTVARLGGDEFAVILECPPFADASQKAAIRFSERAIEAIAQPISHDGRQVDVGASIGIAICPADGDDADTLLHAADMAMYRAKEAGRGTYRFFQRSMEADLRARAALEDDVRQAIAEGHIAPYYQPLIKLSENRLIGFEILARWHHPTRGDVAPDIFIPVAERLGLIASLTYALLERACNDARTWPSDVTLSLNVSPYHLDDPLLAVTFLSILSKTGFPPNRLEIEVTEQAVTRNIAAAHRTVKALRDLGIKISLDDFGTGYANFSHLREFQFDRIKIDRSFVQSMETDAGNAKLVRSILDLAKNLGLPTIAEGIEHLETLRQIMASGGEIGQGFYFARAMPAADAEKMLKAGLPAASRSDVA